MIKPRVVSDVDLAFGGNVHLLMPKYNSVPEEFRDGRTKWNDMVDKWFYEGLPEGTEFVMKKGVDKNKALRYVTAVLKSFEPKHEHKMAGCAYLMSLWFEDVIEPEVK